MKKIFLASASPRRRELLGLLGEPFEVMESNADENIDENDPVLLTEKLSKIKAESVYETLESEQCALVVIGSDTVVYAGEGEDKLILQKPKSKEEARQMIRMISGCEHVVCTGVTVIYREGEKTEEETFSVKTRVRVADMSDGEIEEYISSDEPYDKAGGYGIQGTFSKFITGIEGDYFNVVGLPVHKLYDKMKKMGIL